jgi:Rad3-related DNA helicase
MTTCVLLCVTQVHDIEDLAKIGKRHTACPYFAARHLADSAELIFCPYSYLLDPNIRRSTRVRSSYFCRTEAGKSQLCA